MRLSIVFVTLALLLACIMAVSAGTPKTIDSKGLWEKYRTVLFEFLRQGDPNALPGLQLVAAPTPAEFDTNPVAFNTYAGSIPKWGISWDMSTKTFAREYETFLRNLKIPTSSSDPALEAKRMELEEKHFMIQMDLEETEYKISQSYEKSFYKNRYTFEQYRQRNPTYRRLVKALIQITADVEVLGDQILGDWFIAQSALTKFVNCPPSERDYIALGSTKRFADEAKMDQTNSFEVKVTSKTVTSNRHTYEMGVGVGVEVSYAGINAGVGVNYNKQGMEFKTNTDELQIIIGAKGWKAIPVQPKLTWYEPELFERYRNKPQKKSINFFGSKKSKTVVSARIPHFPKTFYIAAKPYVTMFVSKEDATEIQKSTDLAVTANVGYGVANLNFNFNKKDTKEFKEENSKLYKVTLEGKSPTPVLFAVDNHILAAN